MTGESFQVGELVDVTIRRARVERHDGDVLALSVGGARIVIPVVLPSAAPSSVTTERVAPAEWPPQAGDLWRDRHDELWFFRIDAVYPAGPLRGNTATDTRWTDDPAGLIEDNAPMTLVHREPEDGVR